MRTTSKLSVALRTTAAALGVAMLGAGMLASPASAKPGGAGTPFAATSSNKNCVVTLKAGANPAPATTCFATFTQAIRQATGGAVTDARATADAAMKDPSFLEKVNAAARATSGAAAFQAAVVGVEFEAINHNPNPWSFTFSGPAVCTGPTNDIDYSVNLPAPIWDQISSFQAFFPATLCLADHYFLQNFGLPRTGFAGSRTTMPPMNVGGGPVNGDNNTRSITWS